MKKLHEVISLPARCDYRADHTTVRGWNNAAVFTVCGEANTDKAAALVEAINSYPTVVDALKDAAFALEAVRNLTGNKSLNAYITKAKKALKLAGEG